MANLIIDIGNTALKAAWADGMTLGKTFRYQGERMLDFILSLTAKEKPGLIMMSSVRNFSSQALKRLENECGRLVVADESLVSSYGLPSWLTPDRVASIVASRFLFKNRNCTIFDFGTALIFFFTFYFFHFSRPI